MAQDEGNDRSGRLSRRQLVLRGGAGAGGLLIAGTAAACGSSGSSGSSGARGAAGTIKIGFVSPLTGPAAGFGEPDPYVVGLAKKAFAKGIVIAGKTWDVQIIEKDNQATPSVSAQVANDLIHSEGVDLLLATSTPEVGQPRLRRGRGRGRPVHLDGGALGGVVLRPRRQARRALALPVHLPLLLRRAAVRRQLHPPVAAGADQQDRRRDVAERRRRKRDPRRLGPLLKKAGYTIVDPGAYQDGTNDYSSQIATFKQQNCEIFNTFPIPPDFATFWRQAAQQGYTQMVKIAQIAKTGLFESQVDALGSLGKNLATGFYWGPTWPYKSSLTGISNADLARANEAQATSSGTSTRREHGPLRRRHRRAQGRAAIRRTRSRWQTR